MALNDRVSEVVAREKRNLEYRRGALVLFEVRIFLDVCGFSTYVGRTALSFGLPVHEFANRHAGKVEKKCKKRQKWREREKGEACVVIIPVADH